MALQESIDRLLKGCAAHGWTIDEFLALPGAEIVEFARSMRIPATDLRGICELLMQELDALELPEKVNACGSRILQ